ncbi:DUF305 domain-containing protein [Actinophytocola sp.]|uniref:DUF305 domain-containing protein n=1 Tax=Actinophytocola sp. TaxID=1872138 RepID=UPI002EDAF0C8
MRTFLIGASAAAIIAVATGCGGSNDTPGMNHNQDTTSTSPGSAGQTEHNEQDIAFAQAMIPHHQQAVDMAKMAGERATDPKVKDLATRIEGAQAPEIRQLTEMLDRWGAPTEPSMPGMDHGGMAGPGMMTDAEMQQLEHASGADFDRLWVQMMIKHHQGAVDMAKTELAKGGNAEAKALAQQIIDAQEAEISEMQAMLA